MTPSRPGAAVLIGLLVAASAVVGAVGAGAATADARGDAIVVVDATASPSTPAPGESFDVTASVERAADGRDDVVVREVELFSERDGDGDLDDRLDDVDPDERLAGEAAAEYDLSATLDRSGEHTLYVRYELRSAESGTTEVIRPLTVTVRQPHPRLQVTTERTVDGAPTNVTVTVSNGLNRSIEGVELSVDPESATIDDDRRVLAAIESGANHEFRFRTIGPSNGPETIDVQLTYTTVAGERRTVERSLNAQFVPPANPGAVTLTSLDTTREGDALRVRGTASNAGSSPVSNVVVSVGSSEGVAPARSNAEYFVGQIGASDFSPFEVTATLSANDTVVEVPLTVSYVVDGVRRTETVTVDRRVAATAEPATQQGAPLPLIGGGALAVVVVGGLGWRWSNGRS